MISKKRSPVVNLFVTQWKHLGNQKGIFILYMGFFLIAGSISLATPYVIGLIFNSIHFSKPAITAEYSATLFVSFSDINFLPVWNTSLCSTLLLDSRILRK